MIREYDDVIVFPSPVTLSDHLQLWVLLLSLKAPRTGKASAVRASNRSSELSYNCIKTFNSPDKTPLKTILNNIQEVVIHPTSSPRELASLPPVYQSSCFLGLPVDLRAWLKRWLHLRKRPRPNMSTPANVETKQAHWKRCNKCPIQFTRLWALPTRDKCRCITPVSTLCPN